MSTMDGLTITTDCRVPVGQLYASPGMYVGPHTCTEADPCDARVTVTEFLLARIAEREAVARGSGVIAWLTYRRPDGSMDHTELASATVDAPDVWVSAEGEAVGFTSAQVVYDERRVLADCEAKRKIIAFHESWPTLVQTPAKFERDDVNLDNYTYRMSQEIAWLTTREYVARFGVDPPTAPMLAALALPYADHSDYLPEWNL